MPPARVATVSQITALIKQLFESTPQLQDVWVSGEVSNFKLHTSGHCYLTLKDEASSLRAVIWRTAAARLDLPRDGDQVIAHGYIAVYEAQGQYQLYVDHLEPAGLGRLWLEFERLKARLAADGLFDAARKRPLPVRPRRLGIATSATAAALRDILRTLAARYPLVDVILAPTPVQGADAPPGIVAAIEALNRWSAEAEPLDAILLARGGGSIEELWAFNDERVARAIAASAVPVITGIGHETDFTIADFAADVRAPTPTGAATMATPDRRELAAVITARVGAGHSHIAARLAAARSAAAAASRRLAGLSPERRIGRDRQRIDDRQRRALLALANRLIRTRERVNGMSLRLAALDPGAVLTRGYAIVTKPDQTVVSSTAQVTPGEALHVRVSDGAFGARVAGP